MPADMEGFLLRTAVVERVCGPLCEALLDPQTRPGQGAAMLGRLMKADLFAVALGNLALGWLKRLPSRDREILLACAAGAGLGAVYAVPLGGALFTLRIMLKTWHPRAVGAALITSSLAVSVSSFVTHNQPNLRWPNPDVSYRLIAFAVALAPLTLVIGVVFNRLMGWAGQRELPRSWLLIPAIGGVRAPVLRHRIITNFNAEAEGIKPDDLVRRLADLIPRDPNEERQK